MNETITGDLSVSGNASIGGECTVQDEMMINGNLTVKGWLLAVNVRDIYKGVYTTSTALSAAYPNPQDGWIAGVGASAPFAAYFSNAGEWTATGGAFTPDNDNIDTAAIWDAIGLRALKSEMTVTNGTGVNADKVTIQLKDGTSATVLREHQDISGKANVSDVYTKTEDNEILIHSLGKAVGEAVIADYEFEAEGKHALCADTYLSLAVVDGVGYETGTIEVPAICQAKFIFADPSEIPDCAYEEITQLKSVHIPSWVHKIGEKAFSGCTSLTTIVCESMTPPVLGSNALGGITLSGLTLKVHNIAGTAYATAYDSLIEDGLNLRDMQDNTIQP